MENTDKITIKDIINILKSLFKDIYHADARKYRDEVHIKFPNGQKFMLDIYEKNVDAEQKRIDELFERILADLSDEGYNKKFEKGMLNMIKWNIWIMEEIEAEITDNQVFVTLKTGQEYIVTIQKK